ncbi:MAG TPA: hypothetical protein VMU40_22230 [Steroidobacteraceae bacterium]|nr:hypothetical protein [Steroidobacteraceae bacterium]
MTPATTGAIVAVAFWLFLGAAAVSAMRYDFKKRQLSMESLRAAIERGQQLDPGVVEKLLAQHREPDVDRPQDLQPYLRIGGVITVAAGVGVGIAGAVLGLQVPLARLPMMAAGVIAICIGIGLLIASRVLVGNRTHVDGPSSMA